MLFTGAVSKAVLYKAERDKLILIGKTGFFFAKLARNVFDQDNRIDILLKAHSKTNYFIQVILYHGIWMPKMPVLENFTYAEANAYKLEKEVSRLSLLWDHFFTGIFFMFFVFGLIKYLVLGKDRAYLYYSLLGLSLALLTLVQAQYPPLEISLFENIRGIELFDLVSTIVFIMHGFFIIEILQLKIKYPRITRIIKWYFFAKFMLYLIAKIIFFTSRTDITTLIYTTMFDVILFHLLLLGWVVYLATIRKGFYRFIFLGTLTIFLGYSLMDTIAFFGLHHLLPKWFGDDSRASVFHFTAIAFFIDMLFYFTGLAHRDKEVERQVGQLKQMSVELEMAALRSQMNPHFIFNSLNSINRFILQNNKAQASEYLTKFSRLVRLILQNSQAALISLESELESLQLYLELEAVRFDHHFEFKISVDDELDTDIIKVPPLIIQPYAENAIWHGLMQKEEKGHLEIKLYQQEEILCCRITDDGIGRKKAAELKSKTASSHKSMGMQITASRIEMLQQKNQLDAYITITDLVLADGSAGGTEVMLKIPIMQ